MPLPYEGATSGEKALGEAQKILRGFGVTSFGHMLDWSRGELLVQFEYRGRRVELRASMAGYANAWKKEHPYNPARSRKSKAEWEKQAQDIAGVAVYSILRDWIKGQITAVETGLLTFEAAFMPHFLLPDGKRVIDRVQSEGLLPAPEETSDG